MRDADGLPAARPPAGLTPSEPLPRRDAQPTPTPTRVELRDVPVAPDALPPQAVDLSTRSAPVDPKHPRLASVRLPVGGDGAARSGATAAPRITPGDALATDGSPASVSALTLPASDTSARPAPIRLAPLAGYQGGTSSPAVSGGASPVGVDPPQATAASAAPALDTIAWSQAIGASADGEPAAEPADPLAVLMAGDAPFVAVQAPGEPVRVMSRRAAIALLQEQPVEGMTVLPLRAGAAEALLADIEAAEKPVDLARWFAENAAHEGADRSAELMTIRVQRDAIRDRVLRVLLGEDEDGSPRPAPARYRRSIVMRESRLGHPLKLQRRTVTLSPSQTFSWLRSCRTRNT